ncbi:MAG: hypothetical protein Fur0018_11740 [Anaerolineales bacterium]
MNPGQQAIIVVSVVLVVWYVAFSWVNRKRGVALYHWLRRGAEVLGPVSGAGWIGSAANGGQMVVEKAAPPFSRVELTFLLQSREILPLWLFNLWRGKRDELILKISLRNALLREVEAVPAVQAAAVPEGYVVGEPCGGLRVAVKGEPVGKSLRSFLERYGEHITLFSLKRAKPHLIIRLRLETGLDAVPSETLFRDLQRIFS